MSKSRKKFTIITVVYNDVKNIENTLKSVFLQSLDSYEYIVIDGNSTDGTMEVVNANRENIDIVLTEKDQGIYDAMNKGILMSTGEWILFLNSGDLLFDSEVLSRLNTYISNLDVKPAVLFGDVEVLIPEQGIKKIVKARALPIIEKEMPFNHQSSLINSDTHKDNLYNINYRIVADYDLFLRLYQKNEKFIYVGFVISSILAGGVSDSRRNKTFLEKEKVHNIYFPNRKNKLIYYNSLFRFYIANYFKRVAPSSLVRKIYQKKYK